MGARHDAIPESIWQAIFAEVREGTSYAALARKWGPKVEKQFGVRLTAAKISQESRQRIRDPYDSIWDVAARVVANYSAQDLATLPADGAEQHDHYIYGTPKRS